MIPQIWLAIGLEKVYFIGDIFCDFFKTYNFKLYSCSFTRLGHHLRIINESSQHWKITLRPWKAHFPGHPPGPGSLYMENSYSWYIAFSIVCVREFESWPKRWYKLVYFKFSIWGNWLCFFFLLINIYLLNMSIITSIWDIL